MRVRRVSLSVAGLLASVLTACGGGSGSQAATPAPPTPSTPFQVSSQNSSGTLMTFSPGPVDLSGPMFSKLGTNDRTCVSCHDSSDGWSLAPAHLQQRFQASQGTDPVFRPVDGANCPSADVSTLDARTSAYSLLLN